MQLYYGAHMPTWRKAVDWALIGVFSGLAIVATFGSGERFCSVRSRCYVF